MYWQDSDSIEFMQLLKNYWPPFTEAQLLATTELLKSKVSFFNALRAVKRIYLSREGAQKPMPQQILQEALEDEPPPDINSFEARVKVLEDQQATWRSPTTGINWRITRQGLLLTRQDAERQNRKDAEGLVCWQAVKESWRQMILSNVTVTTPGTDDQKITWVEFKEMVQAGKIPRITKERVEAIAPGTKWPKSLPLAQDVGGCQ